MTLSNKRFQFDDRFINADSFVARISMCDVGRLFSVTVTGAVHVSCGAAQIRSCLQHSTQCMPYKLMHNAFNSTDDRLYKCDCLLQPTRLAISISSTFTSTAQHNQISIDFRTLYDVSSHFIIGLPTCISLTDYKIIISYPAYFLRSLIIQLNIECFINR